MKQLPLLHKSFVALACLSVLLTGGVAASAQTGNHQGKTLAGYFEEWSIYYANYNLANLESNGSAAKLSHLIYAFGDVSASATAPSTNTCVIADAWADFEDNNLPPVGGIADTWPLYGNFAEILKLKQLHPQLKTVISLGGASDAEAAAFSTAASTEAGRQALVSACINMFVVGNVGSDWNGNITAPGLFDGFNIDWEFPAATDKTNFTLLLEEFRNQLNALSATTGKQYILSFDGPAGSQNYTNIDLKSAAEQVDFITIDGYNYAGSWDTVTNDASPLFDSPQDPEFGQDLDIADTVTAYLKAGVPAEKYVMGVPLYGAGWTGVPNKDHGLYQSSTGPSAVPLANGTGVCTDLSGNTPGCDTLLTPGVATYSTLANLTANGYKNYFDLFRIATWLYDPTSETFYTYDTPTTAFLKTLYIQTRVPGGLGGAFVWAVKDDDANGTMVKTLAEGLGR
ncbi:MAG: glycosyl hydrolase family 18 protein [Terracidiphilus sp.]